jgi:hypothetical protein
VPSGDRLALDDSTGYSVNSGTIDLGGDLTGSGSLDNSGSITVSGSTWSADGHGAPGYTVPSPEATITGNAYDLQFSVPAPGTAPSDLWVFAPSLTTSGEVLPGAPSPATAWESGTTQVGSSTPLGPLANGSPVISLSVVPLSQTVRFTSSAANETVGGQETLGATGGASGEPVVFSVDPSTTNDACSVSGTDGTALAFNHAGTCVIDAKQDGNGFYTEGQNTQQITVLQATPGVLLSVSPTTGATVSTPVTLNASVVGVAGGPTPAGTVTFTVTDTTTNSAVTACTTVTLAAGSASCDLGTLAAGAYSLTVSYSGNSDYLAPTPATQSGYPVSQLATSAAGTVSPSAPVFGQAVTVSEVVAGGGSPVSGGTVQWSVDGSPVGAPVLVGTGGSVTSPALTGLSVGSHTVTAAYSGTGAYVSSTATFSVVVGKASTSTSLSVSASTIVATVSAVAPGAGTPTGTVTFYVAGNEVGTAPLSASGVATLAYTATNGQAASASYGGDTSFTGSSSSAISSAAVVNPTIAAKFTSAKAKTRYGWYSKPVTVTFSCTAGSAPISGGCPAPVVLSHDGAGQSITRTIHAGDGGTATVVVSPINIDRASPHIRLRGVQPGGGYLIPGPTPSCSARAGASGLVHKCTLSLTHTGDTISYRATAISKAGLRSTITGSYRLLSYLIAGAPFENGRFVVKLGQTYTIEAYSNQPIVYQYAAPTGTPPGPGTTLAQNLGKGLWAIRVQINQHMAEAHTWTLGIIIAGVMRHIPIYIAGT